MTSWATFCDFSPIWDQDLLLNNTYPRFTDCFQNTLLVWIPFGLVWVILPFYLHHLVHVVAVPLPLSCLNISKVFLSLSLFFLSVIELIYSGDGKKLLKYDTTAYYLAKSITAATFLLVSLLLHIERIKGIMTSGVMFVFYLLVTVSSIIPFYTRIEEKEYSIDRFRFTLFCIYFALLLVQLVLVSMVESHQRAGYQEIGKPQCPEVTASFPSQMTFEWITSLVIQIYRAGIKDDELWELHPRDQTASFIPKIQKAWVDEVQKSRKAEVKQAAQELRRHHAFHVNEVSETTPLIASHSCDINNVKSSGNEKDNKTSKKKKGPSLFMVLVRTFGYDIFIGWLCKFVYDLLQFISPLILSVLIAFVQSGERHTVFAWKGYVYACSFFVVAMLQSVFYHQNFHIAMTAGMRIKSALTACVYGKALTMNNDAKKETTVGEIVNLMSVDCQRIQDVVGYIWMLWSSPLQIILAMVLLWQTLGPSVLAGLAILILLIPINAFLAIRQRKFQIEQMAYKDSRIKLMSEILNGIKVLKLYAWEPSFEKKVQDIRDKELNVIKKASYLNAITMFFWTTAPFLVTLATFATYILVDNEHYLDAQKAFVSLSLFNILRFPINLLPMIISYVVQGHVSLGRIGRFLQTTDLNPNNVQHTETADYALSIENGTFSWSRESDPILKDINVEIPNGKLIAVVGQVGCGKSSLISAFLGEMEKLSGTVKVAGSVAYVSQQAWIQNATFKANVLFGNHEDPNLYQRVIEACALKPDLAILQGGDLTEIGEKGINLSGGQKQRVSLARAVYSDADVYLLDDPLSAVDSHVGKHIFKEVIGAKGLLKNKTRILVTHGVHWLPMVDMIVVMVDGRITELGSYEELLLHDGAFAQFLKMYLIADRSEEDPEIQQLKSKILEKMDSMTSASEHVVLSGDEDVKMRQTKSPEKPPLPAAISSIDSNETKGKLMDKNDKQAAKLIDAETAETGTVSWKVYMKYLHAVGGIATIFLFLFFIIYQIGNIWSNIWLAWWTDDPYLKDITNVNKTEYKNKNYRYLGIYASFGVGQAIVILFYAILAAIKMVRAACILHNRMLENILKLPMEFFDTTPIGRIVNRFSRDVETVDNNLPQNFRMFLLTFFATLSSFAVIGYSTPYFLIVIIPVVILYYFVQKFYIPTSRQLKRIESTTRSPIYSHFGESIAGASTIRGYRLEQRFVEESRNHVDKNMVFYFAGIASNRWLGFRLEFLGNLIVLAAAIFAVVTPSTTPGLVGLSISYALQVTSALNYLVRNTNDVETNVVSVERIKEYSELETEAEWVKPYQQPPQNWPDHGHISINKYSTRYRKGLDLILKGMTCQIMGGERVGIVGRTGAGKSSLTLALFRLLEATDGSIIIDGQRISDMGLHDLRSKLTILPQDPVLFSGTLRMNLDPFDQYSDNQIWAALEHSHLKTFISGLPDGLQHHCVEGGQNLSVGQRQLVCLARTLLRKTKILVFDEATAAVDMETDDLIQKTIREEFRGSTILTIAHRLNTIMDYDKILVLDQGNICEFDSTVALLTNTSSIFYGMAKVAHLV